MCLYALHDSSPELKRKGAFKVTKQQALDLNKQGYGIHWTPNTFNGTRKADNLKEIRYWIADIDDGTKEDMMYSIQALPVKPTVIVETKKGYHCYWKAKNPTIENYRHIQTGLIKRLNADPACKDVCRMLRSPNYYHLKDPNDPFMVKVVENNDREHEEDKMLLAYRVKEKQVKKVEYKGDKQDFFDESKWERLYNLSSIGQGGRNNDLSRIRLWLKDEGFGRSDIYNILSRLNQKISSPLDEWEVKQIARVR